MRAHGSTMAMMTLIIRLFDRESGLERNCLAQTNRLQGQVHHIIAVGQKLTITKIMGELYGINMNESCAIAQEMVLNIDPRVRILEVLGALTRNGRYSGMRHEILTEFYLNDKVHLSPKGGELIRGLIKMALADIESRGKYRREIVFNEYRKKVAVWESVFFEGRRGRLY